MEVLLRPAKFYTVHIFTYSLLKIVQTYTDFGVVSKMYSSQKFDNEICLQICSLQFMAADSLVSLIPNMIPHDKLSCHLSVLVKATMAEYGH